MKVESMTSPQGNKVANQFIIIDDDNNEYFQSYDSIIAKRDGDSYQIYLDEYYWDYSRTTGKYRNEFLNEGIVETRAKIESGEYKLSNLN